VKQNQHGLKYNSSQLFDRLRT